MATVIEQPPDVTAVWAFIAPPSSGLTASVEQPTGPGYDLNQGPGRSAVTTGPSYEGELTVFGAYSSTDPGSLTHPIHGGAPVMARAHTMAAAYTPVMTFNPPSLLHSYLMEDGAPDPVPPASTVVTSGGVLGVPWDGANRIDRDSAGYYVRAVPEAFEIGGSYTYGIHAMSQVVRARGFVEAVGVSGGDPDYFTRLDAHPDGQIVGSASLVSLEVKPDLLNDGQRWGVEPGPTVPLDYVDYSDAWRRPYQPGAYWGPSAANPGTGPDPDVYGTDRNQTVWLATGGAGGLVGMRDRPSLPVGEWTPVPDLGEVIAYEGAADTIASRYGLCFGVLPRPLHRGEDPAGYGLTTLLDGPFDSALSTYGGTMVFRTVIRPAPITYTVSTTDTWLRAMQRTDGLDLGGPPRAVQRATTTDSVRAGTAVT